MIAALTGAFLGLALLKFGNPPIMERWVVTPDNVYELLLGSPWPIAWAYVLLGVPALLAVVCVAQRPLPRRCLPRWFALLPLVWLAWQAIACSQSLSLELSLPTFKHFAACVACFYIGFYCLSEAGNLSRFWVGIVCGFVLVLAVGWEQHFGGLQASREFFFREIYPHLQEVPPEYLKKMSSTRVFSTLFYPNTLAGALLLLLPLTLTRIVQAKALLTPAARGFLAALVTIGALGCLFWSRSKGGWLLMMLLSLAAFVRFDLPKSFKVSLVSVVLVAGLAGFVWKYAEFFQKGATSVSARRDYWEAALRTACRYPWTGTGPGTFMIPYREIKRPDSEMTRMVHNDYLEQASDSGWPGLLVYITFIGSALFWPARRLSQKDGWAMPGHSVEHWTVFSLWLGTFGWAAQSLFEFGLYIPALAWPAFTFLGLLTGWVRIGVDKTEPPG